MAISGRAPPGSGWRRSWIAAAWRVVVLERAERRGGELARALRRSAAEHGAPALGGARRIRFRPPPARGRRETPSLISRAVSRVTGTTCASASRSRRVERERERVEVGHTRAGRWRSRSSSSRRDMTACRRCRTGRGARLRRGAVPCRGLPQRNALSGQRRIGGGCRQHRQRGRYAARQWGRRTRAGVDAHPSQHHAGAVPRHTQPGAGPGERGATRVAGGPDELSDSAHRMGDLSRYGMPRSPFGVATELRVRGSGPPLTAASSRR